MIMASIVPLGFRLAPSLHQKLTILKPTTSSLTFHHYHKNNHPFYSLKRSSAASRLLVSCMFSDMFRNLDGGGIADPTHEDSTTTPQPDIETFKSSYEIDLAVFIRMLGLDNDPRDRERAIVALWKYSQGGNHCIDGIMKFNGCINLTVNLLQSDSDSTCTAAAGLLRTIASVNIYRGSVAESGAIEEITALLSRSSLTKPAKEQSLSTLWNLSLDEKLREKIANMDLLPILIKSFDDNDIKVKEVTAGVLANLALSCSNHKIMVEAGVIPKLAEVLKSDREGFTVIRKKAENALLELAKDEFYKILVMEEGLILVPLIGVAAYKSLKPVSHSWPSLPDGTELERNSSGRSPYGSSELLIGLNRKARSLDLEEAKTNAMIGLSNQQFLVRVGIVEKEEEEEENPHPESSLNHRNTLLPWIDGVARLVLILDLEDVTAISRAARLIGDASINEHMRMLFRVAGAVKHLVCLLNHSNENVRLAACHALEKLSVSKDVCHVIEAEGALHPLVEALKRPEMSEVLMEKTVNILARILDPGKEMKSKFYDVSVKSGNTTKKADGSKAFAGEPSDVNTPKETTRACVLDGGTVSHLCEILKTYPNLQRKVASILEWVAIVDPCIDTIMSVEIESALDVVFHQRFLDDMSDDIDSQQPERATLEAEEAGLAISAASQLLMKLLDFEQFRSSINSTHFTQVLRKILKSDIPLHNKDWVAACLVKLESSSGSRLDPENPVYMEVTIYKTIPQLIEQIKTSFSTEAQEAAVLELNKIMSKGVVDFTRAVADKGGIFPLVKVIEEGTLKSVGDSLAILFNLSMDSENHSAIIAAGAVPGLRRIVLSQGPQWTLALRLLRTLPT